MEVNLIISLPSRRKLSKILTVDEAFRCLIHLLLSFPDLGGPPAVVLRFSSNGTDESYGKC